MGRILSAKYQKTSEWKAGYLYGLLHHAPSSDDNPYFPHQESYNLWDLGFEAGAADRERGIKEAEFLTHHIDKSKTAKKRNPRDVHIDSHNVKKNPKKSVKYRVEYDIRAGGKIATVADFKTLKEAKEYSQFLADKYNKQVRVLKV